MPVAPAHEILPIAGPSHLNLSHGADQQTATLSANIDIETSSNTLIFVPSIPNTAATASKPRPKPKARAKGKEKAPAQDDFPTPHNLLETVNSQEGSNTGAPATLRRLRKSITTATQKIVDHGTAPKPTRQRNKVNTSDPSSHDATKATVTAPKERPKPKKGVTSAATPESTALAGVALTQTSEEISPKRDDAPNQNAPSATGRKRKANNIEPPSTVPAPKKVRVTRQTSKANGVLMNYEVVPQVQDSVSGTTTTAKTNVTSGEPTSSSMVVDASPGKPGQQQLRRGRSRKTMETGQAESVHADTAMGATTTVKRGRGRLAK